MKRNVIISGIAVLAVSTGIISYMVSATPQSTPEAQESRVQAITAPEVVEEVKTEATPTTEVVTEAPAPTPQPSTPSTVAPSVSRDEVALTVTNTVSSNWNAKQSGLMISNANIISLVLKTYDGSPESFKANNVESITLTCIDRIKTMTKEEAIQFVYGDSCL